MASTPVHPLGHLDPPPWFGDHILSCPACWSWQLHWTDWVALQWIPADFEDLLETILREHVAYECPHPALLHTLAKDRGIV